MAATKRSLNKCVDCKYTWYPKGKDLSARCPECASVNVKYAGMGLLGQLGLGAVIVAGIFIFSGKDKNPTQSTTSEVVVGDPISPIEPATSGVTISPNDGTESGKNKVFDRGEHGGNKTDSTWPPVSRRDTSPVSQTQVNSDIEKTYSEQEISQMEIAKQYQGDDPIVRRRLQLPSRETGKLIP